jgi:hypothetical protein
MEGPDPQERETQTLHRTARGILAGLVVGAALGAILGAVVGTIVWRFGAGAMWGATVAAMVFGAGLGWFIGGISTLDDPARGDEPVPDPQMRGDADPDEV